LVRGALRVLDMELDSYHPSGTYNAEVAPGFLEKLWIHALNA